MSPTSSLIAVRDRKAGEPVGYGGHGCSERDTLGVCGDGVWRWLPTSGAFRYAGTGQWS